MLLLSIVGSMTKTNDESLDFEINVSESVSFDVTANQTNITWRWFIDNLSRNQDLTISLLPLAQKVIIK